MDKLRKLRQQNERQATTIERLQEQNNQWQEILRTALANPAALKPINEQPLVTVQPSCTHSSTSSTETTSAIAMSPKASEEVEMVVATTPTANCDNSSPDAGSTATKFEQGFDNSALSTTTQGSRTSRKRTAKTASSATAAAVAEEVEAVATADANAVGKSSPNIASTDVGGSRSKSKTRTGNNASSASPESSSTTEKKPRAASNKPGRQQEPNFLNLLGFSEE